MRRGDQLVHDTLLQIQNAGDSIRRPLKVHFIGEEGVDEGGVQKVPHLLRPLEVPLAYSDCRNTFFF